MQVLDREERVTALLDYMAKHKKPCRVTELSKELQITKSSICRILMSLKRLNWVVQLPSEEYVLGDKVLEFSLSVLSGVEIRSVSSPYLEELNNTTRETVGLVIRTGMEDICIDQIESKHLVRHVLKVGSRYPLWSGASGRVILANMDDSEIEEIIGNLEKIGEVVSASGQVIDSNKLKNELAEVRRTGFAISLGERTSVTAAVAAPIFERNRVIGSIILTGPLPRFDEDLARSYSDLVVKAARNISMRLGSTTHYSLDILKSER